MWFVASRLALISLVTLSVIIIIAASEQHAKIGNTNRNAIETRSAVWRKIAKELRNGKSTHQTGPINQINEEPIIGVLAQETPKGDEQYIAASYVKYAQSGGAQVVPIFIGQPEEYYRNLLDHINGVLLPGGGNSRLDSGYARAASTILTIAIEKIIAGIHFPVHGTCLSFEKIITYFTGDRDEAWITRCDASNVSLRLEFPADVKLDQTQMFDLARPNREDVLRILATENVTANYHHICLTPQTFRNTPSIYENFILISQNTYGKWRFVSTFEHRYLPIFGTQWHPEKNPYEWVRNDRVGNINRNEDAIRVSQYFANFLIAEARKNSQTFPKRSQMLRSVINSYLGYYVYTGKHDEGSLTEAYIFPLGEVEPDMGDDYPGGLSDA